MSAEVEISLVARSLVALLVKGFLYSVKEGVVDEGSRRKVPACHMSEKKVWDARCRRDDGSSKERAAFPRMCNLIKFHLNENSDSSK